MVRVDHMFVIYALNVGVMPLTIPWHAGAVCDRLPLMYEALQDRSMHGRSRYESGQCTVGQGLSQANAC